MNFIYEKMTIDELWQEYILIGTKDIRDEIIIRNTPFAENLARKKSKKFENSLYPIEDAMCSAKIGLIEAFDRFDPFFCNTENHLEKPINDRFLGWSSLRISGQIVEGYRESCWHNPKAAPAKTHSLAPQMFSTIESYVKNSGPSDELSFDPEDRVNDTEENISYLTYKDFLEDYQDACFELNDNQQTVMNLFYVYGLKQNQISETLNETVSFVQTQKAAAIRIMKRLIKKRAEDEKIRRSNSPKTRSTKGLVCH